MDLHAVENSVLYIYEKEWRFESFYSNRACDAPD